MSPFLDVLAGRQVLIVEDELIIAWEIQRIVELLGCEVLGPARCVDAALALLQQSKPDAALLDINLRGKAVTPVATECRRQEAPFALVTAYARLDLGEPVLDGAVRVRKPWNDSDLRKVLVDLIDKRGLQA